MSRSLLAMLGCLVVGAGGMWVASNFRVKFEPVAGGNPPPAPRVTPADGSNGGEPAKLPPHLLAQRPIQHPAGEVVPAGGAEDAPAPKKDDGRNAGKPAKKEAGKADSDVRDEDVLGLAETLSGNVAIEWGKPAGVQSLATELPRLTFSTVQKNGDSFNPANVKKESINVTVDGVPADAVSDYATGTGVLTLDLSKLTAPSASAGRTLRLEIQRKTENAAARSTVTVIRPRVFAPDEVSFTIDRAGTAKSLDLAAVPLTVADATAVNGYVRIQGRAPGSFNPATAAFFVLIGGKPIPVAQAMAKRPAADPWDFELQAPPLDANTTGRILALARFTDGKHAFTATAFDFTFTASSALPTAPTALTASVASDADANTAFVGNKKQADSRTGLDTVFANVFKLNVKATPAQAEPKARAFALFADGEFRGARAWNGTDKEVDFGDVSLATGREHVLRVEPILGGAAGMPAQLAVNVVATQPQVTGVSAPEFGRSNGAAGGELIRIQFNPGNPINPATVTKPTSFEVVHLEGDLNASLVTATPNYDPDANAASVKVDKVVPGSYAVRVKADVKDIYGNALAAGGNPNPKPTFVYETTLFTGGSAAGGGGAAVATVLQAVLPGVTPTGKPVEFPEYTPFREFADGANPSDRVETRVVRLYYSRDAHRVAQIINRDSRSFNGPAVAIARRAAEDVRDQADAIQLERQRQERAAVLATVATRGAENELKQVEARLQTARTEKANTTVLLSQRQQQLDVFTRTLGRDQTNIGVRRDTDASADDAARRLTQAQAVVERSRQALTDLDPSLSESSTIGTADAKVLEARNAQAASQRAVVKADLDARAAVASLPAVSGRAAQVKAFEDQVADSTLPAGTRAQAQASLPAARTELRLAEDAAIARDVTQSGAVAAAIDATRSADLKVRNATAARQALLDLPAQKAAAADAQQALNRAKAVATGRAATDPGADPSQDSVNALREEIRKLQLAQASAASTEQAAQAQADTLRGKVQSLRADELRLTEAALGKDGEERRKREEQFRREVAAALADPDTYAAGKPDSKDPVLQCSVSVIGEGLIHIRGPVKGLNVIRTMINQIDAPTGQVRVGVHTVQVNGERVDRMNKVVDSIQRYIDHARFLTGTSTQMLRNAVTTVAARKAAELGDGDTQDDRDQKYLYAFFGKDFIDELKALDSEFLRTGNKLLSLHSMDSTSLASALFLMSLARNDVREDILREFQAQVCGKLPQAEWDKFVSGLGCPTKCEACFDRSFCMLAKNAKFPAFLGFFNNETAGPDTLTPVQREFVRLAQIFKARLVTEMELKQRVMERTLLEDRVGDFRKEQKRAKEQEDAAREAQFLYQLKLQDAIAPVAVALSQLEAAADGVQRQLTDFEGLSTALDGKPTAAPRLVGRSVPKLEISSPEQRFFFNDPKHRWILEDLSAARTFFDQFVYLNPANAKLAADTKVVLDRVLTDKSATPEDVAFLKASAVSLFKLIGEEAEAARREIGEIARELRRDRPNIERVLGRYETFRREITPKLARTPAGSPLRAALDGKVADAFATLQQVFTDAQAKSRAAQLSRRPLDEKKLLDMLVDDMEEKLIELLEGTRAHTANVDNYIKAVATALDDDFATQFYQPAFKRIRALTAGWDVQLGQVESTTVLTNNRVLGKVSPTASMEFDLPRREILIKEAFKGAKAAVQDYGALLNDPVFLSLVKAYAGNPAAARYGGGGFGGLPAVRNVLPGLPGSADETLFAQTDARRPEFGTYLENLIPDPAVYKFETGTGYEVRPVISPDGQAVVFAFDYMYTTDVREPVRADEKHLGRVKRHLLHTDVQLSNYELREVSKYWVTLKAARTGKGVALLQDLPVAGTLFRPAPSAGSSLQQNLIYAQTAIFPTLFDLMGLRYARAVADLEPGKLINDEFATRAREEYLRQHIFDYGASRVDDALRILYGERRPDLYRAQRTIPYEHPNGYRGPGLRQRDAELQEEYDPRQTYPPTKFAPGLRLPQGFSRDPYNPVGGPDTPAALPIPPAATIPGHSAPSGVPGDPFSSRGIPTTPLGTTITRGPLPPRSPTAPVAPPPPPRATAPVAPTGPVTTRSQAPPSPPPGPVSLPPGSYFPK